MKKPTPGSPGTCLINAIIAHEFIHALGLYHEQSRPDRDDFLDIYYDNIQPGSLIFLRLELNDNNILS